MPNTPPPKVPLQQTVAIRKPPLNRHSGSIKTDPHLQGFSPCARAVHAPCRYNTLFDFGMGTGEGTTGMAEDDPDADLVPQLVRKLVLPIAHHLLAK